MWPRLNPCCCISTPPSCRLWHDTFQRPDSDTIGNGWVEDIGDWDIDGLALVLDGPQTVLRTLRQNDAVFGAGETLENCRSISATFKLSAASDAVTILLFMDNDDLFAAVSAPSSTELTLTLGAGTGNTSVTFDVGDSLDAEFTVNLCYNEAEGMAVARLQAQALTLPWGGTPTAITVGGSVTSGQRLTITEVSAAKTAETDATCPECPVVTIPEDPEECANCLDGVAPLQVAVTLPAVSVGAGNEVYGLLCDSCDVLGGTYVLNRCYGTNPLVTQCAWCLWFETPEANLYCKEWIIYFVIEEAPGSGHDYRMFILAGGSSPYVSGYAGIVWEKYYDGELDCLDFDEDVPFSYVDSYGSCALPGEEDANAVPL